MAYSWDERYSFEGIEYTATCNEDGIGCITINVKNDMYQNKERIFGHAGYVDEYTGNWVYDDSIEFDSLGDAFEWGNGVLENLDEKADILVDMAFKRMRGEL